MKKSDEQFRCHVCKTFRGDVAKALDELVNKRRVFSSYASAVAQAVIEYYKRFVREDLEISRLQAMSTSGDEL